MRKFAFLLAIVAVFAMSATAFAATTQNITNLNAASKDETMWISNISTIADNEGTIYVFPGMASVDVTLFVSVDQKATADAVSVDESGNLYGKLASKSYAEYVSIDIVSLDVAKSTFHVYTSSDNAEVTASGDLKITLQEIDMDGEIEPIVGGGAATMDILSNRAGMGYKLATPGVSIDIPAATAASFDVKLSGDVLSVAAKDGTVSGDSATITFKNEKATKIIVTPVTANAWPSYVATMRSEDIVVGTNLGTITITAKDRQSSTTSEDLQPLSPKDEAALNELGITARHDVVDIYVTQYSGAAVSTDANYLADGIRIVQPCPEGEAVVFGAGETFASDVDDNRSFQLVKRFIVGTANTDVALRYVVYDADLDVYTLNAAVAIINDAYSSANYPGYSNVQTGGPNGQYAVAFVDGDANNATKSNVIVIWDGVADTNASDPIGLKAVGYHSSSSSCSMGFGLAAVAGLAALALRKRSK